MELDKRTALLAAIDAGNLTRAAEKLGYTQSGLSYIIKTLEAEVGFPLLLRSRTGVQPTAECRRILPLLRDLEQRNRQLEQETADIRGLAVGTVSIASFPCISRFWLPAILRDFEENKNKQFKNAVDGLFPARLVPIMIQLSGIDPEKKVHEITREERKYFEECIKGLTLTIAGTRGFEEAIITRGGVRVKEVNPSTMESRLVPGLYMAGEMLDLDALTGGFNLQIAWSTGYLAGASIP